MIAAQFMDNHIRSIPIIGLISAESLSLLGNQMAAVAIPILVLHYTESPLITGIAGAGNIIPIVLAAFIGGRAIDKFGAWRVSVFADLLSFASVLALPLVFLYLDTVSPLLIFLLVFIGALFDPTGISARQTLVPGLARMAGKPLDKINSYRGALENGADFLGPIIGVVFISLVGVAITFFINALTFLLCAIIFVVTVPRPHNQPSMHEANAAWVGARFIFKQRNLRALAVVGMMVSFVILPFLGLLLPVLATQKFANPTLLGLCLSAFGMAATVGALSFSKLVGICSRSMIYYGGLLITAIAIMLCAFVTAQYGVILSAVLAGLLLGAGNPLQQAILQEETPPAIAGQVFTSLSAIHFVAGPVGLLLAGLVTQLANVETVLLSGGGLLLLTAGLGWYFAPLSEADQLVAEKL